MKCFNKIAIPTIIIVLFLAVQACSQQKQDSTEIVKKAENIREYYSKAKSKNDTESMKQFFKVFPDSFSLFKQLYGYDENGKFHILYDESELHIGLFCELKDIVGEQVYYRKLIGLGINGHWQADAVNILQHCIKKRVKENLPLTIGILENYSNKEIMSFWYFLFDGPQPPETMPIDIDKMRNINSRIASLAEKAFHEVHENAEPHGK